MKAIRFSDHAVTKLKILLAHGVRLDEELMRGAITYPHRVVEGYRGRKIAQKGLDQGHILRVVYEAGNHLMMDFPTEPKPG